MYCNNLSNVTEEEKGPLLYLLYWRRERTFAIFVVLKKRKDLYYICCTEEEKGPLPYLLYWRRERTFTIFVVLKKRKDLYYICCTEEEKGPLLYLLYWRRERTFTIFVVLVRERTFTIFVVLVTFLIMSYVVRSEISWLNDWMIDSRLLCTMKVTESVIPDFRLLP
jgi:hypothetical protein